MLQIFQNTKYDFQGRRKITFVLSAVLILVGLVATVLRGGPNYSIDFTGGMQVILRFENSITETPIREAISDLGYPGAEVKIITGNGQQDILVRLPNISNGEAVVQTIQNDLQGHFADNQIEIRSVESVGPKIGHELRNAAILAILA